MTTVTLTSASTSPWVVPSFVSEILVECYGGGGNGAGKSVNGGGAGGAGGVYSRRVFTGFVGGESLSFSVAAVQAVGIGTGATGQTTWFKANDSTGCVAPGGQGGLGTIGGVASVSGAFGDIYYRGGSGGNGGGAGIRGGGGGESGGPAGVGGSGGNGSGSGGAGGSGAVGLAGNGGAGRNGTEGVGNDGVAPGGGGGGAYRTSANQNGGQGAEGRIIITYDPPFSGLRAPLAPGITAQIGGGTPGGTTIQYKGYAEFADGSISQVGVGGLSNSQATLTAITGRTITSIPSNTTVVINSATGVNVGMGIYCIETGAGYLILGKSGTTLTLSDTAGLKTGSVLIYNPGEVNYVFINNVSAYPTNPTFDIPVVTVYIYRTSGTYTHGLIGSYTVSQKYPTLFILDYGQTAGITTFPDPIYLEGALDDVTMAETYVLEVTKPILNDLSLSDADIIKTVTKPFSESATMSETFLKLISKGLTDDQEMEDEVAKTVLKSFSDTVNLNESFGITGPVSQILDFQSMTEVFGKTVYKSFSEDITMTEDLFRGGSLTVIEESQDMVENLSNTVNKPLTDFQFMEESFSATLQKGFNEHTRMSEWVRIELIKG